MDLEPTLITNCPPGINSITKSNIECNSIRVFKEIEYEIKKFQGLHRQYPEDAVRQMALMANEAGVMTLNLWRNEQGEELTEEQKRSRMTKLAASIIRYLMKS